MSIEAATILRKASETIEKNGHWKGAYVNPDPNGSEEVCLWGAIHLAAGAKVYTAQLGRPTITGTVFTPRKYLDRLMPNASMKEIISFLREEAPDSTGLPGAEWNDKEETTAEDVAKFLLATADKIEFL